MPDIKQVVKKCDYCGTPFNIVDSKYKCPSCCAPVDLSSLDYRWTPEDCKPGEKFDPGWNAGTATKIMFMPYSYIDSGGELQTIDL